MPRTPPEARRPVRRWNRVFEALSTEPRRQLVVSLLESSPDDAVPLPESAINPELRVDRDALAVELRHRHLPMLADREFVEWESDPFVARRGPRFPEVATVFETVYRHVDEVPDPLVEGCRGLEARRTDAEEA